MDTPTTLYDRFGWFLERSAWILLEVIYYTHLWFMRVTVTVSVLVWLWCWRYVWQWLWEG